MSGKCGRIIAVVVMYAVCAGGCGKQGEARKAADDDPVFVTTKEIVVGHGRGRTENPPCIRRGMDDVMAAAKGFATQQRSPSYEFLGKDTPAKGISLDDPLTTRGVSTLIRNVDDEIKNVGPEAKALENQAYSSCGTVAFLVPRNAAAVRVVVSAGAPDGSLEPCNLAADGYTKCQVEQAGWMSFQENRYLVVTFKNWSATGTRLVKIDLLP